MESGNSDWKLFALLISLIRLPLESLLAIAVGKTSSSAEVGDKSLEANCRAL